MLFLDLMSSCLLWLGTDSPWGLLNRSLVPGVGGEPWSFAPTAPICLKCQKHGITARIERYLDPVQVFNTILVRYGSSVVAVIFGLSRLHRIEGGEKGEHGDRQYSQLYLSPSLLEYMCH